MLHALLLPLLFLWTVNARGGFGKGGFGNGGFGSGGRNGWGSGNGWPTQSWPGFHGGVQTSSTPVLSVAVTTVLHTSPSTTSTHPLESPPASNTQHTSSSSFKQTTHTSSSSTSTSSLLPDVTNAHVNASTINSSSLLSSSSLSSSLPTLTNSQEPTPSPSTTASGQLGNSNSKVLTIVGICVASALVVIALAGCFVFRHFSKRAEIKFSSDSMVRPQMRGVAVYSPPAFHGTFASTTPLIDAEAAFVPEKIPNPFASDLDYSSESEISYDAKSDVSEHAVTVPGPSVHSYAVPQQVELTHYHP